MILATTPEDPQGLGLGPRTGNGALTGLSVLNIDPDGVVRHFQSGYRLPDGQLFPSLSGQLARAAVPSAAPPSTTPQTIRYVQPDRGALPVVPFRDLVNGSVRYAQLQDKLVLIGLTATGSQGASYLDVSRASSVSVVC